MEGLRPPDGLLLSGNVADNWRKFKQRLELYLAATEPAKARNDKQKAAIFLHVAGAEAIEIFNTFGLTDEERTSYSVLVTKFEEYCTPRCNETYERYKFRTRMQAEGESFESFFRDVKLKAQTCNFEQLSDSMIRDQIVYGVTDTRVREKLLREDNLTLEKTITLCQAVEVAKERQRTWDNTEKSVALIAKQKGQARSKTKQCGRCNTHHEPRKCPAYGKACHVCRKKNHFSACCKSKTAVDKVSNQDDFSVLEIGNGSADWIIPAIVSGREVQLKADTGSQANLLPLSTFKKLGGASAPKPSRAVLRNYSGGIIGHIGIAELRVKVNGTEANLDFFIVKGTLKRFLEKLLFGAMVLRKCQ
ncbi:uncharacterized protein ISCGN_011498 [Ixodes scapularis]